MALPTHVPPNNQMWERWFYTENPVWLTFQASSEYLYTISSQVAVCNIAYSDEHIAAGETITLQWEGNTLVFTFALVPLDDSGNQIAENGAGIVPYSLYYITIVAALSLNYTFNQHFTIGANGPGYIEIKIKKPNIDLIVSSSTAQITANVVNPPPPLPNYNIALLLDVADNITSLGSINVHQKPNQSGFVRIDIAQVIKNYVPWITPGEIMDVGVITKNKRRIRVAFTEQYGEPPVPKKLQYTQEMIFVKGGVLWQEEIHNYDPSQIGDIWLSGRFLTKQPQYKTTTIRQPEWLFWLHHDTPIWAAVKVECSFVDGSTVTQSSDYWVWLEQDEIVSIGTSYEYLNGLMNLDGGTGVVPVSCRVVLYNTDTNQEISMAQYYNYIDCYFADRYLIVANRWGGADTILLAAPAEIGIKTTEKGVAVLNQDYHVRTFNGGIANASFTNDFDGQEQVFLKKSKDIIKTDTASIYPKDHLAWLKDSFLMSQMWEISDSPLYGKLLLPIDIVSDSIKIDNEAEDLSNVSFEYTYRIEN